jgi:tetratricopeptide (TPR) repeat protein
MVRNSQPALLGEPRARIFISYSRKDMAFADRIEAALKARDFEPLIDRSKIYAFEDWWQRIEVLIGQADTVVFVLSPDAVTSDVALREVAYAASLNKRLAPIVCRRVDNLEVPESLRRLNFIYFDDPQHFEASANQLAEGLQTDIGWLRKHTEFGEAARRWSAAGFLRGLLLRSPLLEEAERWLASRPRDVPEPTGDTQAFVGASRRGAIQRRNILTGSLAAGLVVAMGLAGLAYWQWLIAVQQRDRAEKTLTAATDTANNLVMGVAVKVRNRMGIPVVLVRDLLSRAHDLLNRLSQAGNVSPDLREQVAIALRELATTSLIQGDLSAALETAGRAREIMDGLVAQDAANTRWQRELALSFNRIGEVLSRSGRHEDAFDTFALALKIRQALADAEPDSSEAKRDLAVSRERMGDELLAINDLEDAKTSYWAAFDIRASLVAEAPEKNRQWDLDLSVSYENLGDVDFTIEDFESALGYYQKSLEIRTSLVSTDPTDAEADRDVAISLAKIADARIKMGDRDKALEAYRRSLLIRDKLAAGDPGNAQWQGDLMVILVKLGDASDDPKTNYRRALEIARRLDMEGRLATDQKALIRLVVARTEKL